MPLLLALLSTVAAWSWPLPTPVTVTRPFRPPATAYGAGHRGVDLAGAPDLPVRAAGPGVVSVAGLLAGRGVVVVVHGALRTTYEPVRAAVHVGQLVAGGTVLGRLQPGHVGCPVAACLHWGLLRGQVYVDPLSLVGLGPVRLLPLVGHRGRAPARSSAGATVRSRAPTSLASPPVARRPAAAGPTGDAGATTSVLAESGLAVGAGLAVLRRTRRRLRATP